jgi:phosphoketolase
MKEKKDTDKKKVVKIKKKSIKDKPLSKKLLGKINAYWRAANYLSVGQLYLRDNPLLRVTA